MDLTNEELDSIEANGDLDRELDMDDNMAGESPEAAFVGDGVIAGDFDSF